MTKADADEGHREPRPGLKRNERLPRAASSDLPAASRTVLPACRRPRAARPPPRGPPRGGPGAGLLLGARPGRASSDPGLRDAPARATPLPARPAPHRWAAAASTLGKDGGSRARGPRLLREARRHGGLPNGCTAQARAAGARACARPPDGLAGADGKRVWRPALSGTAQSGC